MTPFWAALSNAFTATIVASRDAATSPLSMVASALRTKVRALPRQTRLCSRRFTFCLLRLIADFILAKSNLRNLDETFDFDEGVFYMSEVDLSTPPLQDELANKQTILSLE